MAGAGAKRNAGCETLGVGEAELSREEKNGTRLEGVEGEEEKTKHKTGKVGKREGGATRLKTTEENARRAWAATQPVG